MTQYDHVGFSPGIQGWFRIQKPITEIHRINRLEQKDTCFYQQMQGNCLTESKVIHDNNSQETKNRGSCSNFLKSIYESLGVSITLNPNLSVFP